MYDDTSRSDARQRSAADAARRLAAVRVVGGVELAASAEAGRTFADSLHETGGYKARFPTGRDGLGGALINTGGGGAGGDRVRLRISAGESADLTLSTPSAERVYRSLGPRAEIDIELRLAPGARLAWLPQETILFNGARLVRRIEADVAPDARLLVAEMLVLGRAAMGETVAGGHVRDDWRVRRGQALVLAEAVRLDGAIADHLAHAAVAAGGSALAMVLLVAPDAEDHLGRARAALADAPASAAASAWNGMLVARVMAPGADELRRTVARLVEAIDGRALPRVWGT